jgi:hypothetical protein
MKVLAPIRAYDELEMLAASGAEELYCGIMPRDHSGSKRPNGFERILAHRIGCQRARPPCPAERHKKQPSEYAKGLTPCQ